MTPDIATVDTPHSDSQAAIPNDYVLKVRDNGYDGQNNTTGAEVRVFQAVVEAVTRMLHQTNACM